MSLLNRQYAGYLFDLDGTLVDTAPDLCRAQNAALTEFGYAPVSEADTRDWVGQGARVLLQRALRGQGADESKLDQLFEHFLTFYAANIHENSAPYDGVRYTLDKLRDQGAKLAVVTNKPEALSIALLRALDLYANFDALVGGDTAAESKPSAAPAILACERLGLSDPSTVLFVGDSIADVGCARAFQCSVVCMSYGYNQGVDPAELGADLVLDAFSGLAT